MSFGSPMNLAGASLLRPVIALNVWTLVMEGWMYATRIPAISKYNVKLGPNSTKMDLDSKMPPSVRWKADNYNHLLEQPTQFYAVAITLAILDPENSTNSTLAWTYVGIRVAHSLLQAGFNKILVRFGLFAVSSVVLTVMTARAASLLF